jgi:hypothetical protein
MEEEGSKEYNLVNVYLIEEGKPQSGPFEEGTMLKQILISTIVIFAYYGFSICPSNDLFAEEKDQKVQVRLLTTLLFKGKEIDEEKVKEITKTLEKLPSIKIIPHSDATPHFLIEFDASKTDLGDMVKSIATLKRKEVKEEVITYLMVRTDLPKEKKEEILKVLEKVKGIDTKMSQVSNDRLDIALDNQGGAKWSAIKDALQPILPKK